MAIGDFYFGKINNNYYYDLIDYNDLLDITEKYLSLLHNNKIT